MTFVASPRRNPQIAIATSAAPRYKDERDECEGREGRDRGDRKDLESLDERRDDEDGCSEVCFFSLALGCIGLESSTTSPPREDDTSTPRDPLPPARDTVLPLRETSPSPDRLRDPPRDREIDCDRRSECDWDGGRDRCAWDCAALSFPEPSSAPARAPAAPAPAPDSATDTEPTPKADPDPELLDPEVPNPNAGPGTVRDEGDKGTGADTEDAGTMLVDPLEFPIV
eukprot:1315810-Amorphochlora_amoeboformis.AAC.1